MLGCVALSHPFPNRLMGSSSWKLRAAEERDLGEVPGAFGHPAPGHVPVYLTHRGL